MAGLFDNYGSGGRPGIDQPQPWDAGSTFNNTNFNVMPQAQNDMLNQMHAWTNGSLGQGQSNVGQSTRYNTDQGMNNDPWGNRDLNNLAGNGGGGQQPQQANPWDVQQDNRGLQGFGAAPTANQLFGGNQAGGAMSGIPGQAGGQQQANPYGQQQGAFDYNDRAQQDAFVRSLGGNAPAIFGDNGHMTDQDWATRYDAIRQASLGRPLDSFGGPAQQSQRGPGNYYGQGGADPFPELTGQLAQNGDRFKDAFGKFGWNLVTPQGGSQGQAENIARAMAAQNPNVDYEPVDMGGGVWNIATRSRLPGGGQPYSGLLPQPVMPPPVAPAQRYSPAPPRYSSGGGGGYAPRPAAPAPRPVVSAPIQNTMANIFRGIPNIAQLIHGMQPAQQGQIINSPFGGPQVVNGYGQGVPISNVPSSGT